MKIIACNLKMNLMPSELDNYIEEMKEIKEDVIILPPYIYIDRFIKEGFNNTIDESSPYIVELNDWRLSDNDDKYLSFNITELFWRLNFFDISSNSILKLSKL